MHEMTVRLAGRSIAPVDARLVTKLDPGGYGSDIGQG